MTNQTTSLTRISQRLPKLTAIVVNPMSTSKMKTTAIRKIKLDREVVKLLSNNSFDYSCRESKPEQTRMRTDMARMNRVKLK